jgi:sugar phosphate isomerase/epimerase
MKIGCCAYSFRDDLLNKRMSLESFVELSARIGCDVIELTSYYFPSTEIEYLHHLKKHAHQNGVIISGAAVGSDFTSVDLIQRRKNVEMTLSWISHSVELGASTLRVFAGPIREGCSEEEAFRWASECLEECVQYAGQRGILLALENHWGLTETAEKTIRLMKAVGSDWLGLNLDFGNFASNPYEQYAECASYAVCAHAKSHIHLQGQNVKIDYARVRAIMEQANFHGAVSIEYEEPQDPYQAVPEFVKELRRDLCGL